MDNDDGQTGYILSRREMLSLFGMAGAVLLSGCSTGEPSPAGMANGATPMGNASVSPAINAEAATVAVAAGDPTAIAQVASGAASAETANTAVAVPGCVVRPEATEGPYYVDEDLVRSDIRTDPATGEVKQGAPLVLTFSVSQVSESGCRALEGAEVEIWHCDALGAYSGVSDPGFSTEGLKWLRGSQVTDVTGLATFTTIYPGWYPGRAVHIHFKVRPDETSVFSSQLFFDDQVTSQVFAHEPYAGKGQPDTPNNTDFLYHDLLLLTTMEADEGYAATFPIGIDRSARATE